MLGRREGGGGSVQISSLLHVVPSKHINYLSDPIKKECSWLSEKQPDYVASYHCFKENDVHDVAVPPSYIVFPVHVTENVWNPARVGKLSRVMWLHCYSQILNLLLVPKAN